MKKQFPTLFIGCTGFLVLILDTKTALSGVSEGIELCLQTVIPSLFPFLFLSVMLTSALSGLNIPFLRPLCRVLRIPKGAESLLLLGLLGGYPVGAQCVAEAVRGGTISRENGRRMLAFCSNAGPAFLFGIGSNLFSDNCTCWVLWCIHILSALTVGLLTPGGTDDPSQQSAATTINAPQALQRALRVMTAICGWVVIFRVILVFCQRWFLWLLPVWAKCVFAGILELTNGCCALVQIGDTRLRFILCALFLGFGGLCVSMQTYSVTAGVDTSLYLPGKLMQALLSSLMAAAVISREIALIFGMLSVTAVFVSLMIKKNTKKDSILSSNIV